MKSLSSLSATTTPRTSKLLGPVSIKAAAVRGDTPPLIHNKTQLLATAEGSPAKAGTRQTSHWTNVTLNSPFSYIFSLHHDYCLYTELQMAFSSAACNCPSDSPGNEKPLWWYKKTWCFCLNPCVKKSSAGGNSKLLIRC